MSYYETQAEKSDHFFFEKRTVDALEAHFHSRVEIIIAERGELPVTVNGEKHVLRGGEAFFCDGFSVHSYGKATSDFTAYAKHYPPEMMAGGGPFSGRRTAPLCIAGGIAKQILARRGVTVCAHALRIAGISDIPFDPVSVGPDDAARIEAQDFPTLSAQAGEQMQQAE